MKTYKRADGDVLITKEQAWELLEEALGQLERFYIVGQTGHDYDDDEILGREAILENYKDNDSLLTCQVGGWIEVDRRVSKLDNGEIEVPIWFTGIVIIPELDLKLGGGFNDDYRVIRMDYNYKTKEWSKPYVDTL